VTGLPAVALDVVFLGIVGWLLVIATREWKRARRARTALPVMLALLVAGLLTWRAGEKLFALAWMRSLTIEQVRSIRVGDATMANPDDVRAVVEALRRSTWLTIEHSCQGPAVSMEIVLTDGRQRTLWPAFNFCLGGAALNLSDIRAAGRYRGALFSQQLARVLNERRTLTLRRE